MTANFLSPRWGIAKGEVPPGFPCFRLTAAGGEQWAVVPCLNTEPLWIHCLKDMVLRLARASVDPVLQKPMQRSRNTLNDKLLGAD